MSSLLKMYAEAQRHGDRGAMAAAKLLMRRAGGVDDDRDPDDEEERAVDQPDDEPKKPLMKKRAKVTKGPKLKAKSKRAAKQARSEMLSSIGDLEIRTATVERTQRLQARAERVIDRAEQRGGGFHGLELESQSAEQLAAICAEARYRATHRKPSSAVVGVRPGSTRRRLHDAVVHDGTIVDDMALVTATQATDFVGGA